MEISRDTPDGFRPKRSYSRQPGGSRKIFPWRGRPDGCLALVIMGYSTDLHAKSAGVERSRKFKASGASGQAVLNRLIAHWPEFPAIYERVRGQPLTAHVAGKRYHQMYYENGEERHRRARRSEEHYLVNERLRPLLDLAQRIVREARRVTPEDVARAAELLASKS